MICNSKKKKKNPIRLWSTTECQIQSIIHFIKIEDNYLRLQQSHKDSDK